MHIGDRIREERERLGFSQADFAALASATRKTLFNWESGVALPNAGVLAAWSASGLDVLYVVTGQRSAGNAAHDAAEQVLLDSYRRCNAQARQHLIQTAALLAAGVPGGVQGGGGMHMSNLGNGNVQVGGSVGGSVRVRRGK